MKENVDIIQLSKSNYVVAFSKNGIAALKDGKAVACDLATKGSRKKATFAFMRDTTFKKLYAQYQNQVRAEKSFFGKFMSKLKFWGKDQ